MCAYVAWILSNSDGAGPEQFCCEGGQGGGSQEERGEKHIRTAKEKKASKCSDKEKKDKRLGLPPGAMCGE